MGRRRWCWPRSSNPTWRSSTSAYRSWTATSWRAGFRSWRCRRASWPSPATVRSTTGGARATPASASTSSSRSTCVSSRLRSRKSLPELLELALEALHGALADLRLRHRLGVGQRGLQRAGRRRLVALEHQDLRLVLQQAQLARSVDFAQRAIDRRQRVVVLSLLAVEQRQPRRRVVVLRKLLLRLLERGNGAGRVLQ